MTSNWSLIFFFFGQEVVLTPITEAIAQNTRHKKQSEPRGEWREEDRGKGIGGINNPILVHRHCPLRSL